MQTQLTTQRPKGLFKKSLDTSEESVSQMRLMAWVALIAALFIMILGLILMKWIDRLDCLGISAITSPLVASAFAGKWLQKREEVKCEKLKHDNEDPRNPES